MSQTLKIRSKTKIAKGVRIIKFLNRLKFKLSDYQIDELQTGWSYCFDVYYNKKQFIRILPNVHRWEIRGLLFDVIPPCNTYAGKMETKEDKIKATIYSESDGRKELKEFIEYIRGYVD